MVSAKEKSWVATLAFVLLLTIYIYSCWMLEAVFAGNYVAFVIYFVVICWACFVFFYSYRRIHRTTIKNYATRDYYLDNDPTLATRQIHVRSVTVEYKDGDIKNYFEFLKSTLSEDGKLVVDWKHVGLVKCVHVILDKLSPEDASEARIQTIGSKKPVMEAKLPFDDHVFANQSYVQSMVEHGIEKCVEEALKNGEPEKRFVGFNSLMIRLVVDAIVQVDPVAADEVILWVLESLKSTSAAWRNSRAELFNDMLDLKSRALSSDVIFELCKELFPTLAEWYAKTKVPAKTSPETSNRASASGSLFKKSRART